jgi:hypothetical protein
MSIYLTIDGFKDLSTMPSEFVDEIETRYPGWLDKQFNSVARWIDARLRKRYEAPFAAYDSDPATPTTVQDWVNRIVTMRAYMKRGIDPNDLQWPLVENDHNEAKKEVLEAANSQDGWFELPLRDTEDENAVTKTGPLSYSEQGPYTWTDRQRNSVTDEDRNGSGTRRG